MIICRCKNGMDVVGKGSWKDREVGKFYLGKNLLTADLSKYTVAFTYLYANFPARHFQIAD